jgi:hypothetical protein
MAVQITPIDGVAQPTPIPSDDPWAVQGAAYDWVLAGLHFNEATNDSNPVERAFQRVTKDAIDQSPQPGDQSLDGWWIRSQTDWSGGAGYRFMEPISQDPIPRTFWWSYGVNVWNEGQLYLHRVPKQFVSISLPDGVTPSMVVGADTSGTEYLFVAVGTNIYRYPLDQVRSGDVLTTAGTPFCVMPHAVVSLMTAEGYVYAVTAANGIWRVGSTPVQFYRSNVNGYVQAWWVKERMILAAGRTLYEVAGATALVDLDAPSTLVNEIVTATDPSWKWVSATDGPKGILVAGRGRQSSSISLISVEPDGSLPVLAAPFVVAEFAINERVREISAYLSRFLMVSTNAGVRLAVIDADGTITYGPLLRAPYLNGKFSNFDRFSWASVDDAGEGRSGLIRFSYADVSNESRVPWAMDVRVPTGGGQVVSQEIFAQDEVAMLSVSGAAGSRQAKVWVTHPDSYTEEYGRLQSGSIRMGSTVKKSWSRLNLVGNPQMVGNIEVEIVTGEYVANVGSMSNPKYDSDFMFADERLTSGNASVRLTLRRSGAVVVSGSTAVAPGSGPTVIVAPLAEQRWTALLPYTWQEVSDLWLTWDYLGGGESDHVPTPVDPGDGPISVEPVPPSATPIVESWTLRAVPTIERTELVRIPLAVFDDEADSRGVQIGGSGTALKRYEALVARVGQGRAMSLKDLNANREYTVVVDELSFRRTGKASRGSAFGGVIDVVARVI